MRDMGLDIKAIMKTGDALALAEQSLKFFAPLQVNSPDSVPSRRSCTPILALVSHQTL
jgi:hypothetical protein